MFKIQTTEEIQTNEDKYDQEDFKNGQIECPEMRNKTI